MSLDNLTPEQLKTKAQFYLDSAVRSEQEIEHLQRVIANLKAEGEFRSKQRVRREGKIRAMLRRHSRNFEAVKRVLFQKDQTIADLTAALDEMADKYLEQYILVEELTQPPPGEVDVVLNPETGAYE